MVLKVTVPPIPPSVQRAFASCLPLSKVTKVALCALGLLVALYCIKSVLMGRVSKPPATQDPKPQPTQAADFSLPQVDHPTTKVVNSEMGFAPEIIELLGGEERFNRYEVVFCAKVSSTEEVSYDTKMYFIACQLNTYKGRSPPAISLGTDNRGCPFIRVGYINTKNKNKGYILVYSNIESEKLIWYINQKLFLDDNSNVDVVRIRQFFLKIENGFELYPNCMKN